MDFLFVQGGQTNQPNSQDQAFVSMEKLAENSIWCFIEFQEYSILARITHCGNGNNHILLSP